MGIVLCLLVSDKPITVVIVGNNIGPEYFHPPPQLSSSGLDPGQVKVR